MEREGEVAWLHGSFDYLASHIPAGISGFCATPLDIRYGFSSVIVF